MPTVLRSGRWRVLVHTDDHPPPHVHVRCPGGEAKVALSDIRVERSRGIPVPRRVEVIRLVEDNREYLLAWWKRSMDEPRRLTDAEILEQFAAAEAADRLADATEPRARTVSYDAWSGRVVVELKSGAAFAFPPSDYPELANRTAEELSMVEPSPSGDGLEWEALDVQISVPGILASMLGPELVRAFARRGGSATSERKAAAARENGRRGGRPRKRPGDGTLMAAEPPFRWGDTEDGKAS